MPASAPSTTTNIAVWPSARSASARAAASPGAIPSSSSNARLPSAAGRPSTRPTTPLPVRDSNASGDASAIPRAPAPSTMAAASGCSLPRSSEAATRSRSASFQPPSGTTDASAGLPRVSVPVLSTTSVSTLSQHLDRFGVPEQHARRGAAARGHHDRHRGGQPQRTGARDDEHGHGVDDGVGRARLGTRQPPHQRGADGHRHHGRHEVARHHGRPASGSARGCAAPRPPSRRCARAASRRRRVPPG